jgi:glycosyltransferase involved in cell wall biosynthesis
VSKKVLVIVPTFSNSETLANCLSSIQGQTHFNLEVKIISDGASKACLDVAREFCIADPRFELKLNPKSHRRGEQYRHEVILASNAEHITYLADDDLFVRTHVEHLLREIEGFDFVNPFPAFVNRNDEIWCMPTDVQFESSRAWHLSPTPQNSISLSGVMHTRNAYLRLEAGWSVTPDDFPWTDLYMWQKFMARTDFLLKTCRTSTVVKFLGGSNAYDAEKISQNKDWFQKLNQPDWPGKWNAWVEDTKHKLLAELFVNNSEMVRLLKEQNALAEELRMQLEALTGVESL